jgi:osmoprotectant transport system permease protein
LSSGVVLAQISGSFFHDRSKSTCESRNGFCPDWIWHHVGDYVSPTVRHLELTVTAVVCGFVIAFALAIAAHRKRWLVAPITGVTGILYTIPSLAFFALLLPITGFGFVTATIALTSYTLLILFRNIVTGLDNVPEEARDAARGMGMGREQMLWSVELPLALPEIIAGVRIATTTTVGLATLAFFAGAGGLGEKINSDIAFKSNIVLGGALCLLLALVFDVLLLGLQRLLAPWQREARA